MNKESLIKEEIYKCSKCGLCKSVCPVYLATKNEMFLPRGRYVVFNDKFLSDKKIADDFIKNLDICLNCNACKNFCPSNIASYKIFSFFKNRYNYKYSMFNFSFIYKLYLHYLKILSFAYRIFSIKSIFINSYFDNLFDVKILRKKQTANSDTVADIVYFEGCINKYINPTDKNASINLLESVGFRVKKIVHSCCGYPYINEGNFIKFKNQARKIIDSIPSNIKYIVCSCDSCFDTLKKYSEFTDNADEFLSKLIRIDELVQIQNIPKNDSTYYFKPLLRVEDCVLSDLKTLNKKGICSTFENFFALKYPQITLNIVKNNFYKKDEIDDKLIVTTCQLSKLGLVNCIKKIGSNATVLSYSEYILKNKTEK